MANSQPQSELGRRFIAALPESLREYAVTEPDIILRIPAAAAEVGELLVYDDNGEITVAVGRIHHRHFDDGAEAVQWVMEVVAETVRFRNQLCRGELIACSSWIPHLTESDQLLRETDEYRDFTWSGEKAHERRAAD